MEKTTSRQRETARKTGKSRSRSPAQSMRIRTAYHEAGHAIANLALFGDGCTITIRAKGKEFGRITFDSPFPKWLLRAWLDSTQPSLVAAAKLRV